MHTVDEMQYSVGHYYNIVATNHNSDFVPSFRHCCYNQSSLIIDSDDDLQAIICSQIAPIHYCFNDFV